MFVVSQQFMVDELVINFIGTVMLKHWKLFYKSALMKSLFTTCAVVLMSWIWQNIVVLVYDSKLRCMLMAAGY